MEGSKWQTQRQSHILEKKQNTTKNIQEAQSGRLDLCGVDQQNNQNFDENRSICEVALIACDVKERTVHYTN